MPPLSQRVFQAPPDLEQELLQAMQDFERGDYIELTVEHEHSERRPTPSSVGVISIPPLELAAAVIATGGHQAITSSEGSVVRVAEARSGRKSAHQCDDSSSADAV